MTTRRGHKRKVIVSVLLGLSGVLFLVALISLYVFCHVKKRRKPTASTDSEDGLLNFSYQSLLEATGGFSPENVIGSGTFGVVYKGTLYQGRQTVAIKKFNLEKKAAWKTFMAECGIVRNIRHRNLVKVLTVCSGVDYQGNDFKALVYEYMVNGSLDDWLHPKPQSITEGTSVKPKNLNLLQRLDIAIDVAVALEYLHHHCSTSIVHCDLKPNNVLLDDAMVAHVADFGLAKFLVEDETNSEANQSSSIGVTGTIGYTPPEYGLGNELSTQGDVYSFGILLLELFTGKRPTGDQFTEGLNLKDYVKVTMPENVIDVLDHTLLQDIAAGEETSTTGARILRTTGQSRVAVGGVDLYF